FSLNTKGGRCESCKGQGKIKINMDFISDIFNKCEVCNGKRYKSEILEIKYNQKSIADVLEMTFNEAFMFFKDSRKISDKINVFNQTGLSYLKLGQTLNTLSGGELQRLKLASEMIKNEKGKKILLLDEPTSGLHFEDVKNLIILLDKLQKQNNTIIITEHNLTIMLNADYIIDLGIGGGENGGNIIAKGNPKAIASENKSLTANCLKRFF
ncbi:MAG: ATP-binding cassette domain-containing protein, partial [Bacteroidales bacterium]|nr:ATP-binding cassette domain-containing protein [Bacteroidales bacterium]